jgi:hypothetical protein
MKFLADMGISPRVVEERGQNDHDAIHSAEQGLNRSEALSKGAVLSVTERKVRVRRLPI